MKTYLADIIPRIQRFSQKLDDLTKLTNQHWISLGDIEQAKRVYIFRSNNQLLISENGIVEKGTWEYLGNQSILIETVEGCYLLKHGFFDENIIALKINSTNKYAFFINETKFENEINSIEDVIQFLTMKYVNKTNYDMEKPRISNKQKEWMENPDYCPGCGYSGVINYSECPDCGLRLI
jgi:hypothetical protein